MGTPLLSPKGGAVPQIFGPCLLCQNGWMDQDGTWRGDRPQPRRLCIRWGPSPPRKKGAEPPSPIFGPNLLWPNCWMDQGGTCMEVDLGPGHIVLDWDTAPLFQKGRAPSFGPCLLWPNGWVDQDATWYGSRSRSRPLFIGRVPSYRRRGTAAPPPFGPCLLWPRSPISATSGLL